MQTITISKIGITRLNTDIIVNAANSVLQEGGGVCGAIFQAAGSQQLQDTCDQIGGCETGSAVITPGFKLCKYIVHAVGPIWRGGNNHEPNQLYDCYRASLNLARDNDCHSIGFPLISAGIFGYPKDKAWRKALQAINDWFKDNPDYDIDVQFAILDDEIIRIGNEMADSLNIVVNTGNTPVAKKKKIADLSAIHAFAVKYRNIYLDPKTKEHDLDLEVHFADECFDLGFDMDCAKEFSDKYSNSAFSSTEGLLQVIDNIDDVQVLASGIFSKWRYVTHWVTGDILQLDNRNWMIAALFKLSELTK